MADYRTERLAVVVVVVIVISGHNAVMVNDSYSVSEKVAKKKNVLVMHRCSFRNRKCAKI